MTTYNISEMLQHEVTMEMLHNCVIYLTGDSWTPVQSEVVLYLQVSGVALQCKYLQLVWHVISYRISTRACPAG